MQSKPILLEGIPGQESHPQVSLLSGFEGVIQFYEMRQKFEADIIRKLPIRVLMFEHSSKEWEFCETEIVRFINPYL
jgi:hypothetical protein